MSAEDFLQESHIISHYYDDKMGWMVVPDSQVKQAMVEFAKMHVKFALEAAKLQAQKFVTGYTCESILNVYPDNLIQ